MPDVCQQPMKDMRKKNTKGKWEWTYVPCGKVCDKGQRYCPRHTMLNDLAENKAADKELAARQAAQAETVASGKRTFHPKDMSWSYRKRGSVARTQMNTNNSTRILPQNQNKAIRIGFSSGKKSDSPKMAAMPRNTRAVAGKVNLSMRRAGFRP